MSETAPENPTPAPAEKGSGGVEDKAPRGVYVRVFIYVVATHVLLAFMSLLIIIAKSR